MKKKKVVLIFNDNHCEELTFPPLFPAGEFGYQVKRDLKLSPVKYFNQRLLNYTQIFISDPDYIFFALFVAQLLKLYGQINIAMKKVCYEHLTSENLSQNFSETVKSFIANDKLIGSIFFLKFLQWSNSLIFQLSLWH